MLEQRPMCGIAGIVGDGAEYTRAAIERGIQAIRSRGPDAQGFHLERDVAFGHARLRIIDLSERGAQPMTNEDGTVWIVFNGEIYNYRALRPDLEAKGHRFASETDTEVILHAYEEMGERVVEVLDGMFALAIWDAKKKQLLLARDRAGKKPLYYALRDGRLYFGSEPKALFAMGVPRVVDDGSIPHMLVSGYVPAPGTLYRGIVELPPASRLSWTPGRDPVVTRYWSLEFRGADTLDLPSTEEKLESLVRDAVKKRLVSDVPLGAFLSGGIDSTIIVGLMQSLSTQPVRTFSLGFEGDRMYDETSYAEIAAKAFGTEHTKFMVKPNAIELLPELVRIHDGPFGDSSSVACWLISKLAKENVTVALTGDGGDELFSGYFRFRRGHWMERVPSPVRRVLGRASKRIPRDLRANGVAARARRMFESLARPLGDRLLEWQSYFPENDGLVTGGDGSFERARSIHLDFYRDRRGTPLDRMLQHNFDTYLASDLLPKMDRTSMAHGLETRAPLLDTALMEFAATLPDAFRMRLFDTKWILKRTFRRLLPPAIMKRGKWGFGLPLGTWFRNDLRTYVADHVVADGARIHDYVNKEAVRRVFSEHVGERGNHEHRLWLLLSLEIWLRSLPKDETHPDRAIEEARP